MKHFSRRDFIHAGCTVAAASLVPPIVDVAEARMLRGSAPPSGPGKSVLNSNFGVDWYANLAKTIFSLAYGSNSITANLNSDGYPVGTLVSNISGQMYYDPAYYGHYLFKWTGVGQFSYNTSDGIIIYSGGAGVYGITPAASGFYGGNSALVNNAALTTGMNVEFAWGTLITSVTTSGGWVQFGVNTGVASTVVAGGSNPLALSSLVGNGTTTTATTAAPHGFPTGVTIIMDVLANTPGTFNAFGAVCTITGASTFTYANTTNATATGAGTYSSYSKSVQFNNLTGIPSATTFKIWRSDASNILVDQSAAYAGLVSVTGTGGPGTQTEVIISVGNGRSVSFPNTLPIYGAASYTMSNLIICKKGDLTSIQAGNQISTAAINFLTAYKPRYIRYMDALSAQSFYSDFNFRMPITYLTFNPSPGTAPKIIVPSLIGTMTGTGDAVQLTNPGYQTGTYVDGEIVQWTSNSTSTGNNSTVQLGSRGTAPLFTNGYSPFNFTLTGTITNGDVITTTVTASYLPGGVQAVTYTVNTAVNGPSGLKDTSLQNLRANLSANLTNDPVLAAYGFQFSNNANPANGNLGYVSVTYAVSSGLVTIATSVAGTEVWTGGYYADLNSRIIGGQTSGTTYTAIYNAILQGFVIVNSGSSVGGGLPTGIPIELIKEFCTRCNVGAWFAMPFIYTATSWNLLGAWAAANLPAGTPVICEYANEVWNNFANPFSQVSNIGACVGLPFGSYFYASSYIYYGGMVASVLPNFVTGYTGAGGTRSNCSIALMARVDDISENPSNGCTIDYRLNGLGSTASGSTFSGSISGTTLTVPSGYNGLVAPGMVITGAGVTANTRVIKQLSNSSALGPCRGGTYSVTQSQTVGPVTMTPTNPVWTTVVGANYNAFPNRPVDICDTIGYAPYPIGGLIRDTGASFYTGTQANFNNLFTASQNYGSGGSGPNPTAALQFIDDDFNLGITPSGAFQSYCLSGHTNAHANPGKCQTWETQIATYDGARPSGKANICCDQYEGSKQQSLTTVLANTDRAGAIADLTAQFNTNGWTLTAFGASNAAVATNITDLWLAYHGSTQYYNTMLTNWLGAMATIHAARPRFSPAQFGIEGTFTTISAGVPIWGLFSGDLSSQEMQNGLAFQYYNNH